MQGRNMWALTDDVTAGGQIRWLFISHRFWQTPLRQRQLEHR